MIGRAVAAYFAPAPAARLGTLRLLVGLFAWVYVTARFPYFLSLIGDVPDRFSPVGILTPLTSPIAPAWGVILLVATWVGAGLFTFGWWHRVVGPVFAVLLTVLLTYRSSFGMVFHTENLLVVHVWILGLTAAADAVVFRASRPPLADHGRYGWPVRLLMAVTVASYLVAGVAKVKNGGWAWVSGDVLMGHIAYDSLRKMQVGSLYSPVGAYLLRFSWIFGPLAIASLVLELGAPLFLVSKRTRLLWVAGVWAFHFGVWILMFIFFPYPLTGVGLASFFSVERLRSRFVRRR